MTRFSITTLAAFGILLGTVPVARADTNCNTLSQPVSGRTIDGNLVVTTGTCTLESDVTVGGNVTVAAGAGFKIMAARSGGSPIKIGGNILVAEGCSEVFITSSPSVPVSIGGNVEIQDCGESGYGGPANVKIGGNFECNGNDAACYATGGSVGGNLQVDDNSGNATVENNNVRGNLEVNGNEAGAGVTGNTVGGNGEVDGNGSDSIHSTASGNTIGGNLTCTGNVGTFTGSPNTVHGNTLPKKGSQC